MGTAVTLERYAEMRAEMDGGGLHDSVLARAGITAEEWIAAQREWLERMGMDLERGRLELTNRYTQAFLARQRALRALDSPSRPVVEAAPLPAAVPSPAPAPSTAPRPPMTYAAPTTPENGPAQQPRAVTPPSFSPEALAAIMAVPDDMPGSTTMPIPSSAQAQVAAKSLLPFKSADPPPLPQPGALLAAGETADITACVKQLRDTDKSALPFSAKAVQGTGGSQTPQTSADRFQKGASYPALDATSDITEAVREQLRTAAAPLPFRSTNRTPPPPPQSPSQQPPPQIPTLVVYAQICAELRIDPARAGVVRARHGLVDDSAWSGALRYWQAQLTDPATRRRWTQMVEQSMQTAGGKR